MALNSSAASRYSDARFARWRQVAPRGTAAAEVGRDLPPKQAIAVLIDVDALPLTREQRDELQANPEDGVPWSEVKASLLRGELGDCS
jgi:hypothetical protein